MEIVLGFTGTRNGLTVMQSERLNLQLRFLEPAEARHGDCIGGDEQFHAKCMNLPVWRIVVHPPDNDTLRAFCGGSDDTQVTQVGMKPYLVRNRDIVDASDVMIACPKESEEVMRSGTWTTIRYARKIGKPLLIIYPDGTTQGNVGEIDGDGLFVPEI